MIDNYKIISITPLGRRKYLNLLTPYLLHNSHIIDKHVFWVNTENVYDVSAACSLVCRYPDFFTICQREGKDLNKISVNYMYSQFSDPNTIYIKLNDDICWIHEDAIKNLINFRIQNPDYFLIYPMIVNSGRTANLHQIMGQLPLDITKEWPGSYRDYFNLRQYPAEVSCKIHECFLDKLKENKVRDLLINKYILYNYEYLPEHCICWFGKDFKNLRNTTNILDYNYLTQIEASNKQRLSCICGNSIVSHFSFSTHQKYLLEETDLYSKYKELSERDK